MRDGDNNRTQRTSFWVRRSERDAIDTSITRARTFSTQEHRPITIDYGIHRCVTIAETVSRLVLRAGPVSLNTGSGFISGFRASY